MQCNGFKQSPQNINAMQWHLLKQLPKGKTGDKYYLLFFRYRNKIGLLTPFAKTSKRGGLNKVQGLGKKSKN